LRIKPQNIAFLGIAGLLLAYTAYRAYAISFTFDEGSSFLYYAMDSYRNIIQDVNLEVNNHILNSMAMRFFLSWLPITELTVRLQSLIGHIVFLLFSWLLLKDIKKPLLRICCFAIINLDPYLLDFFSVARGYGMSWGFTLGALYFFKEYIANQGMKIFPVILTFVCAALATLANFTIINIYAPLLGMFLLYSAYMHIRSRRKLLVITWIPVLLISVSILWYSLGILFRIKNQNLYVFGGDRGFLPDTMGSIANNVVYPFADSPTIHLLVLGLFFAGFVVALGLAARALAKKHDKATGASTLLLATLLLAGAVAAIVCTHYLFGIRYVIDRTALFLFVIFLVVLACLANAIAERYRWGKYILMGLALFSLLQFGRSINFTHVHQWDGEADNKQMILDLNRLAKTEKPDAHGKKAFFLPFWYYYTVSKFYQYRYHLDGLDIDEYNRANCTHDYYYYPDSLRAVLKDCDLTVICNYPETKTVLLRNNHPVMRNVITTSTIALNNQKLDTGSFSMPLVFPISAYRGKSGLRIESFTEVNFIEGRKSGEVDISVCDSTGKILDWHSRRFDQELMISENGQARLPFGVSLDKLNEKAATLKIAIWNNGHHRILAGNIKATLYQIGAPILPKP